MAKLCDPAENEREQLLGASSASAGEALALSRWMAAHPELSLAERETSDRYVAWLGARGFAIERGSAGMETAFVARRGSEARCAWRCSRRWTRCPRSATPAGTISRAPRVCSPPARSPACCPRTA